MEPLLAFSPFFSFAPSRSLVQRHSYRSLLDWDRLQEFFAIYIQPFLLLFLMPLFCWSDQILASDSSVLFLSSLLRLFPLFRWLFGITVFIWMFASVTWIKPRVTNAISFQYHLQLSLFYTILGKIVRLICYFLLLTLIVKYWRQLNALKCFIV